MPVPREWAQGLIRFVNGWRQNPKAEEYIGDGPFDEFVLTEQGASWDDFLRWVNELQGSWCFRGQRESEWLLHTSLDRAVKREYWSPNSSGYYHLDRETEQHDLLFRFQQQAHLYIRNPPSERDLSSWFALMQHHGAPTRFLDWTKSPYVAAYFAFEEQAQEKRKRSAVWAIDLDWLERRGRTLLQSGTATSVPDDPGVRAGWINRLLAQTEEAVIVRVDALRTNERMTAQQGVFLCRLLHAAPFTQTLMRMMIHPETPDQPVVRKLEVETKRRTEFLTNLRAMNIHRASLFPGLDGFAQSLRLDLEIKAKSEAG
jgi:hypothetical protein